MSQVADDAAERALSRIGLTLKNKWRLDALLGIGGMAAVYAATHRVGWRGAVKILHDELSAVPEIRRRFMREAYAANTVEHPNAVAVLDDDTTDEGLVFLVMELLEGETVQQRWEASRQCFDRDAVLWIGDQLLDVLASAHDKGIVHRDVKPENLFLTRTGELKVLDFGVARARQVEGSIITFAGSVLGTPAYMPPEQARGNWDRVDARSDLWAVGATMFTLLAGQTVHHGQTINELLAAAMSLPAPPLRRIVPGAAPEVAAIVDRALAFRPEERWPDARAMQAAVRAAFAGPIPASAPIAGVVMAAPPPPSEDTAMATTLRLPALRAPVKPSERGSGPHDVAAEDRRERAHAYVHRGVERSNAGLLVEALDDYTRALELIPTYALAFFNRGVARQAAGDAAGAIEDYTAALDLRPDLVDALFNRAMAELNLKDFRGARADAMQAGEIYRAQGEAARGAEAANLAEAIAATQAAAWSEQSGTLASPGVARQPR
jgi:serine/threonine-protein kinase